MKTRPGDQPLPTKNDRPFIQDLVIADIEKRKLLGIERYGTPLQAFNDRDSVLDAYEEALDLTMYLRQWREERDKLGQMIRDLHTEVSCRIDHGAESGGHLDYVLDKLTAIREIVDV